MNEPIPANEQIEAPPPSTVGGTPGTDFWQREQRRRQQRIQRLNRIAEVRASFQRRHTYYHSEFAELIKSLLVPGQRVLEVGCQLGDLLAKVAPENSVGVDASDRFIELGKKNHPELDLRHCDVETDPLPEGPFDAIIVGQALGMFYDIQIALERLRSLLGPRGRLIVIYYNFIWEPVLKAAERVGLKTRWPEQNWLSMADVEGLLHLSGYEVFRRGNDLLVPMELPAVSSLGNRLAAKLPTLRAFALLDYFVARPVPHHEPDRLPSVSVICPCRNEKGNIREAVRRTPLMGPKTELIFVDGNSTDGTVEEIQQVIAEYKGPLELKLLPQGDGKGKGDAVRKGFAAARHEVLMILDSDLTVPPEELPKFYTALIRNKGEFINGVRLVYPMEGEAMRFLNQLGNKFFSVALSWVLEQPIKDSLCGTKVLYKRDYDAIAENRKFFGEFDPFGDFDLLFGAARLNLRIVDLPVRYRARTYGETKISRFSHGWLLLKMTAFGLRKLQMRL